MVGRPFSLPCWLCVWPLGWPFRCCMSPFLLLCLLHSFNLLAIYSCGPADQFQNLLGCPTCCLFCFGLSVRPSVRCVFSLIVSYIHISMRHCCAVNNDASSTRLQEANKTAAFTCHGVGNKPRQTKNYSFRNKSCVAERNK